MIEVKVSVLQLLFFIISIGLLIGKIKIFHIHIGFAGVLLAAVGVGILVSYFPELPIGQYHFILYNETDQTILSSLSTLGMTLFMAVISLQAGRQLRCEELTKCILYVVIGVLIVTVNIGCLILIYFYTNTDISLLLGIFCGAMTSTPGLGVATSMKEVDVALATMGYGISYIGGVLSVVLFAQMQYKKEKSIHDIANKESASAIVPSKQTVFLVSLVAVIGAILGRLEIPNIQFSLGNSGGVLLAGMIMGYLLAENNNAVMGEMSEYRNLGICLFYVGCGIPAGMEACKSFNVKYLLYGLVLSVVPIALGYLISLICTRKDRTKSVCMVCGIMTSTPAFNSILPRGNSKTMYSAFSLSYIGAMLSVMMAVRIIVLCIH